MTNATEMVEQLAKEFGQVESISSEGADKLGRVMDQTPLETLILIVKANVKFCAPLACNRLRLQHGWTWDEIHALND